jgi:hypothetical protein
MGRREDVADDLVVLIRGSGHRVDRAADVLVLDRARDRTDLRGAHRPAAGRVPGRDSRVRGGGGGTGKDPCHGGVCLWLALKLTCHPRSFRFGDPRSGI